jgi:hypothetical protein
MEAFRQRKVGILCGKTKDSYFVKDRSRNEMEAQLRAPLSEYLNEDNGTLRTKQRS